MSDLTNRQKTILQYLEEQEGVGLPAPSLREIGEAVGISSTSVTMYNVERLAHLGYITYHRGTARGITLKQVARLDLGAEVGRLKEELQVMGTQVRDLQAEVGRLRRAVEGSWRLLTND